MLFQLALKFSEYCGTQKIQYRIQNSPPIVSVLTHITPGYALQTDYFNRLTPNDPYMGRTAPITSKRCILYIYSTNIGTEYFKHALYSPFFLFKMQFVS